VDIENIYFAFTLGITTAFTFLIGKTAWDARQELRRKNNYQFRLPYPDPDFRDKVLNEYLPYHGLKLLLAEGGELGPKFWGPFLQRWQQVKAPDAQMFLLFGPTLHVYKELYEKHVLASSASNGDYEWAKCHPALDAAMNNAELSGIRMFLKLKRDPNETHTILFDDEGGTVLEELPHPGKEPGGGVLYRYHPEVYSERRDRYYHNLSDSDFCVPFDETYLKEVTVCAADKDILRQKLGDLSGDELSS